MRALERRLQRLERSDGELTFALVLVPLGTTPEAARQAALTRAEGQAWPTPVHVVPWDDPKGAYGVWWAERGGTGCVVLPAYTPSLRVESFGRGFDDGWIALLDAIDAVAEASGFQSGKQT